MFALKARVTAYVCVLTLLLNVTLLHLGVTTQIRATIFGALVVASVLPGIRRRSLPCAVLPVLLLVCAYFHFTNFAAEHEKYSLLRLATTSPVSFTGTIYDTADTKSHKQRHFIIDVGAFNIPFNALNRGRLLMTCPPNVAASAGDMIVATGWIREPVESPHPWDYSIEPLLRRVGAVATFQPIRYTLIPMRRKPDLRAFVDHLRQRIIDSHIDAIGRRNGNLLTSMVIGNRNVEVDEPISEAFRNLGISHTLAASGFNLSVVVAATWWLLRPLIANRVLLNICAGVLLIIYVALAGPSASIVRAAIMCGGLLLAGMFGRKPDAFAALGATLVITVMFDPFALSDVGLQLSYLSTLCLVCTSDLSRRLFWAFQPIPAASKLLEVAVPCVVATASVFPLQLYYFWQVGLLQLPANILISPLVPIITLEGFATSTLAALNFTQIAVVVDRCANVIISVLVAIVEWLNSYSWSVVSTGPPDLWKVLVFYAFLLLGLVSPSLSRRAWIALVGLFVSGIALMWRPSLPPLTVVRMYRAAIAIDSDRNAIVVGDADRYQVRKCLSYFGTRAIAAAAQPSGSTPYLQWELRNQELLVTMRKTQRVIRLRAGSEGRTSRVRKYSM